MPKLYNPQTTQNDNPRASLPPKNQEHAVFLDMQATEDQAEAQRQVAIQDPHDPSRMETTEDGSNLWAITRFNAMRRLSMGDAVAPIIPTMAHNCQTLAFWEAYLTNHVETRVLEPLHAAYHCCAGEPHPALGGYSADSTDVANAMPIIATELLHPPTTITADAFAADLCRIHGLWLSHRPTITPGIWRHTNYPMFNRFFTPPEQIAPTVRHLWAMAQTMPPGPRAELIEYGLNEIRPFHYGSGLMARHFANRELTRGGLQRLVGIERWNTYIHGLNNAYWQGEYQTWRAARSISRAYSRHRKWQSFPPSDEEMENLIGAGTTITKPSVH